MNKIYYPNQKISFADVVQQTITLLPQNPAHRVVLDLIDTRWFQRLRDISQTANTKLVYMFSEHSRFGHCLGAAHLAVTVLDQLRTSYPDQVKPYELVIAAAAALHDIGHLAPGSHSAFKIWFPSQPDAHESVAMRVIAEDPELHSVLDGYAPDLATRIIEVLDESEDLPPWVWQVISGSGWNVDRGNWCVVDSVLAGVNYGKYNIAALTDALVITKDGQLGVSESRLDALMHFAISRHSLYRQVYQHRVLLATDKLIGAVVLRARDLGDKIPFADETMRTALAAQNVLSLPLKIIFQMREGWFRYHLQRWSEGSDLILADLADRILHRRLLKTWRVLDKSAREGLWQEAAKAVESAGYDPRYYLHAVSTPDVHKGEREQQIPVVLSDGSTIPLAQADPLVLTLYEKAAHDTREWFAMPLEAKLKLSSS